MYKAEAEAEAEAEAGHVGKKPIFANIIMSYH